MSALNKNVAIITDVHIGARQASLIFAEHQIRFFEVQLIPSLKKQKITELLCLGDLFETRQASNHRVLDMWDNRVFKVLEREGITLHTIIGNHDAALKDTLRINSPSLFLSKYKNISIYESPKEVDIGVNRFVFSPWICLDNYEASMKLFKESKCKVVMGHFEFGGFEMNIGQMAHEGLDTAPFSRFESVFSGHYHHKSDNGRIFYLGSPFEFTWADYNDPRGYHIFNTESLSLKFVKNKESMFYKLFYDDTDKDDSYWNTFDVDSLKGKYVKLIVVNKNNAYQYDRLLGLLYNGELIDLKIIEDLSDLDADLVDDDSLELEDSVSLIDSYVDSLEIKEDKVKLKALLKSLYVEALSTLE